MIVLLTMISAVVGANNVNMTTTATTPVFNVTDANTTKSPVCENGGACCNVQDFDVICFDFPFVINGNKGMFGIEDKIGNLLIFFKLSK